MQTLIHANTMQPPPHISIQCSMQSN